MDEQVSFPLPKSLDTRIHMRFITKEKVIIVHITTVSEEEKGTAVPMGSMVYALPDRFNPSTPLATIIYREEPTFDFATRVAKILVKKTQMHVYVSNSLSLASTGLGGTFEEEMEAFKKVIEVALDKLKPLIQAPDELANGVNVA
ncbi:hypothetical protein BX600DRAFT_512211 [Xylariales sp. PMI_506]|nr:hypothetical protein BX600DRAFT_512211 [Xylariales sp. PMI_506]